MLEESAKVGLTAIEKSGITGTQVGAAASIFGFLTLNQWLAVGGFVLAVLSFIFQVCCTIYFKSKHLELARARFEADLEDKDTYDE